MRKTGICSGIYFDINSNFEEAFGKMKKHGFDCVDLGLANTANNDTSLYHKDKAEQKRIISELRRASEATGIEIYQIHGPWRSPMRDGTEEERAEWSGYMKQGIEFSRALGCKFFVVHPIMPYGKAPDQDAKGFCDLNYEFFNNLLPAAQKAGVTICLENMPFLMHAISNAEQVYNFVKDMNSENMAMCLDTGHCVFWKDSPAEAVRKIGNAIKTLHVHDNDGVNDLHTYPFHGIIDWEDFKDALKGLDETVVLSIEISSYSIPEKDNIKEHYMCGLAKTAKYLAE